MKEIPRTISKIHPIRGDWNSTAAAIAERHVRRLNDRGFEAYWVGGCVRDLLLGLSPKDYDIATNATPDQVERLFPRTIPVGKQFGVILVLEQGVQTEIATFRTESGYSDGRRPDSVKFCSAKEDASRRDFTINGIFLNPLERQPLDWVGGIQDLETGLIRAIGDPVERFSEDHLRMLRAVRFATRFDFQLEPKTLSAIQSRASDITLVSPERIRAELIRILLAPKLAKGLRLLEESCLFQWLFPDWAKPIPSPVYKWAEGEIEEGSSVLIWSTLARLFELEGWDGLLSYSSKDNEDSTRKGFPSTKHSRSKLEELLRHYTFPREEMDPILKAVQFQKTILQTHSNDLLACRQCMIQPIFPLAWKVFERAESVRPQCSPDSVSAWRIELKKFHQKPELSQPLILGKDLLKAGFSPGPMIGKTLTLVRNAQLIEQIHSPEEAVELAKSLK